MNIDFPAILVLVTFVSGLVWAADAMFFSKKRKEPGVDVEGLISEISGNSNFDETKGIAKEPYVVELARSLFPIFLVVLLVRSFIVEPFKIPSNSMMPTLLTGDFILVNKFSYGIRLPVVDTKVIKVGSPVRGDVIVFRYPENPSIDYIKRVVGVPGDYIEYRSKLLYVNSKLMSQEHVSRYIGKGSGTVMTGASLRKESLDSVDHDILVVASNSNYSFEFKVPENEYFVLGDNRDHSRDSRYWGTVPEKNLVGKAFFIWMNWDSAMDGLGVAWNRIGSIIE